MATNVPIRGRRSPLPNEWSSRQAADDHYRKGAVVDNSPTKPAPDCCCHDDEHLSRRYEQTETSGYRRQGGTQSDHKLAEERTSDEGSLTEGEINDTVHGDVRPTYRGFDSGPRKYDKLPREYSNHGYGKAPESHQLAQYEKVNDEDLSEAEGAGLPATAPTTAPRNLRDYVNSVNLPQALNAVKKLERLKELQRRRDLSERFYSQEIKRLIGEHFFSKTPDALASKGREQRIEVSGNRIIGDVSNPGEQRIRAGGFSKELKPCGTMTTITRLDCGCMRETTTPIFNNRISQIKKCEDHRYAECNVPKLATSNPQELTYRTVEPLERLASAACSSTRAKAKFAPDSAAHRKLQNIVTRDLESWHDHRAHSAQQKNRRSPRHLSPIRNPSPARKYSDDASSN